MKGRGRGYHPCFVGETRMTHCRHSAAPYFLLCCCCCVLLLVGCATTRVVTIINKPPDALIKDDNIGRGRGSYTEQFYFGKPTDVHLVVASRPGYKDTRAE